MVARSTLYEGEAKIGSDHAASCSYQAHSAGAIGWCLQKALKVAEAVKRVTDPWPHVSSRATVTCSVRPHVPSQ